MAETDTNFYKNQINFNCSEVALKQPTVIYTTAKLGGKNIPPLSRW